MKQVLFQKSTSFLILLLMFSSFGYTQNAPGYIQMNNWQNSLQSISDFQQRVDYELNDTTGIPFSAARFRHFEKANIALLSGNPSILKSKLIKIEFDYSKLKIIQSIDDENHVFTEEQYSLFNKTILNKEKKGKGDEWETKWNSSKTSLYPLTFEEQYNEINQEKESQVSVTRGNVILEITPLHVSPAVVEFPKSTPLLLSVLCDFKDLKGNSICKYSISECQGTILGNNQNLILGINEAFRKLAKIVFKTISNEWQHTNSEIFNDISSATSSGLDTFVSIPSGKVFKGKVIEVNSDQYFKFKTTDNKLITVSFENVKGLCIHQKVIYQSKY